jgi:hypothetical protein
MEIVSRHVLETWEKTKLVHAHFQCLGPFFRTRFGLVVGTHPNQCIPTDITLICTDITLICSHVDFGSSSLESGTKSGSLW